MGNGISSIWRVGVGTRTHLRSDISLILQ